MSIVINKIISFMYGLSLNNHYIYFNDLYLIISNFYMYITIICKKKQFCIICYLYCTLSDNSFLKNTFHFIKGKDFNLRYEAFLINLYTILLTTNSDFCHISIDNTIIWIEFGRCLDLNKRLQLNETAHL